MFGLFQNNCVNELRGPSTNPSFAIPIDFHFQFLMVIYNCLILFTINGPTSKEESLSVQLSNNIDLTCLSLNSAKRKVPWSRSCISQVAWTRFWFCWGVNYDSWPQKIIINYIDHEDLVFKKNPWEIHQIGCLHCLNLININKNWNQFFQCCHMQLIKKSMIISNST